MSLGQLSWAPRSVWKVANGAMGLTAANASPAVRTRAANGCAILCIIASCRIARRRDGCNGRVVGFNATPSGISLPSALGNKIGVPMRGAVDTIPGDLLLRRHKTRNIVLHQHAVAPIAQFNARDQLGLHGAALRVGAGRLFVIMIGDAMHEPEADPAIRKELKYLGRTGDKRGQSSLVDSAAAEKPQVGEYLIVAVGDPGVARQMVLPDPNKPVGMDGTTAELRRLFEHDRLQAKFVGS